VTNGELIFVTGLTGYVGGCLVPRLLEKGYRVRGLARDPGRISGRSWFPHIEVVQGDLLSADSLSQAMQEVSAAYYLVHNMANGRDYIHHEIDSARNFIEAACQAGVEQIVYLGGLADPAQEIGRHLRSRLQTGEILRQDCVPVTEFQASLVIGSGSISFEMIRYLTEQFPLLFGPRWIHNRTQPVAIQDVLDYLLAALENPASRGKIYQIGGQDSLTYAETMAVYARLRGLKRRSIVLPGLSVKWMAGMAGLLTPVPAVIAAPLLDGMRSDSVVRNEAARRDFPLIQPLRYESAVRQALEHLSPAFMETGWENAASWFRIKREGFFIEGRRIQLDSSPGEVYRVVTGLGGRSGWLYLNGLWKLRGFLDRLAGGAGLRGRRSQDGLVEGDVIDFYRVEALEPDRMVRLRAELKAPGLGWMEWRVQPVSEGGVWLSQLAYFAPKGTLGFLYWYGLLPVHRLVFTGLLKAIARRAGQDQVPDRKDFRSPGRRTR
jgi:uncharacterized protein YbjT (DUF2867 family)